MNRPSDRIHITVVGDKGVGKTSMLTRYATNTFPSEYMPTEVIDFYHPIDVIDGTRYHFILADTGGFGHDFRPINYPPTDIFLVCFSIEDLNSFESVKKWVELEVRPHSPNVPYLIVGMKTDRRYEERGSESERPTYISKQQGLKLAEDIRAVTYGECSALKQEGIKVIFQEAVRAVLEPRTPCTPKTPKSSIWSRLWQGFPFIYGTYEKDSLLTGGPEALKAYVEASRYGTRPVFRARIMFVGQERVGKTSLMKSLMGQKFYARSSITDCVDTTKFCKIPASRPSSTWHQQSMGKHDRVVERKDQINQALVQHMAQSLAKTDQDSEEDDSAQTSQRVFSARVKPTAEEKLDRGLKTNVVSINEAFAQICLTDQRGRYLSHEEKEISPSDVPAEIMKDLPKQVHKQRSMKTKPEGEPPVEVQFWDFAGQEVYYNTHQIFLNHRAIFILVFDLSKDLSQITKVDQVTYKQEVKKTSRYHHFTGLEFLDFWLKSIYTYAAASDTSQNDTDENSLTQPYKSPPILLVGTHRGDLKDKGTEEYIKHQILAAIKGKPYEKHVVRRIHCVENDPRRRGKGDESIDKLREQIADIASKEPYIGRRIPIRWLQFEGALVEEAAEGTHYIELDEAEKLAAKSGINDAQEVAAVLQSLHDLGTIVYFGSTIEDDRSNHELLKDYIILDNQWLIDIFKAVITVRPEEDQWATYCDSWNLLATKGILQDSLVNHVWKEHLNLKFMLLALMEEFDLLCYWDADTKRKEMTYIVPACLQPAKSEEERPSDDTADGTFYLNFLAYLPDGVFNYALVHAARWSQKMSRLPPKLFYRYGRFWVGLKQNRHSLQLQMLPSKPACIKVVIHRKQASVSEEDDKDASPSPKMCQEVVRFMNVTLEQLQRKWVHGIRYTLAVACVSCKRAGKVLHLLELKESQDEVYCELTEKLIPMSRYRMLLRGDAQIEQVEKESAEGGEDQEIKDNKKDKATTELPVSPNPSAMDTSKSRQRHTVSSGEASRGLSRRGGVKKDSSPVLTRSASQGSRATLQATNVPIFPSGSSNMKTKEYITYILSGATEILCEHLEPTKILRRLVSVHVLTDDDVRDIESHPRIADKVAKMLQILKLKDVKAYEKFMNALAHFRSDLYAEVKGLESKFPENQQEHKTGR